MQFFKGFICDRCKKEFKESESRYWNVEMAEGNYNKTPEAKWLKYILCQQCMRLCDLVSEKEAQQNEL